jgi:tyrosine phenol-lyase
MAGRDMEAMAIGIEESVQDDHMRSRIGQVQYLGELLRLGRSRSCSRWGATRSSSTPGRSIRTPQIEFPAQTLAAELYLDSGIRAMERGVVSARARPATGDHYYPKLELTRLTIPRRVYTQAHMDVVAESVKMIFDQRDDTRGLRMVYEPKYLRFFQAQVRAAPRGRPSGTTAPGS